MREGEKRVRESDENRKVWGGWRGRRWDAENGIWRERHSRQKVFLAEKLTETNGKDEIKTFYR